MTQIELSKMIGIRANNLSSLLRGKRIAGPKTAKKIAAYLQDPDWRRYVHIPSSELKQALSIEAF